MSSEEQNEVRVKVATVSLPTKTFSKPVVRDIRKHRCKGDVQAVGGSIKGILSNLLKIPKPFSNVPEPKEGPVFIGFIINIYSFDV